MEHTHEAEKSQKEIRLQERIAACSLPTVSKEPFLFETPLHNRDVIERFGLLEDKSVICSMDLEFTCWEDRELMASRPREIIEFGVSILHWHEGGYRAEKQFNILVRPEVFPKLSAYCVELTGITQEMIDRAPPFSEALDMLLESLPESSSFVWASWGKDPEYIEEQYQRQGGSELLFDPRYINVAHFSKKYLGKKCGGLKKSLTRLGIEQVEPAHRALSDALSQEKVMTRFNLDPQDAMVSYSSSYRERLTMKKEELIRKLVLRHELSEELVKELTAHCNWDMQALNRLFQSSQ